MATNETAAQMAERLEKMSREETVHEGLEPMVGRISPTEAAALAAGAAALRAQAQPMTQVLAIGLCPECGPVSCVDAERCCTGCGADVGMFDRPTMVTTADLRAQAQGPVQSVWLIESTSPNGPLYWDGRRSESFTSDANEAVRFARFEDAERIRAWMLPTLLRGHLRSVAHLWPEPRP